MNENIQTLEQTSYTVTISPLIHKKLERHLLIIKKLINKNTTKQEWLIKALKEKLEKDAEEQEVPKENTLTLKMDSDLEKLILKRIEYVKKFKSSYSKKQWIIDAIIDKLDRDEEEVEHKLSKTKNDS